MSSQEKIQNPLKIDKETVLAFALALAAALLIKVPALFGITLEQHEYFYMRNLSFFVLPLLTLYFAWKQHPDFQTIIKIALAFVSAVVLANAYPFIPRGDTEALFALHLPIALWLLVGIIYSGERWKQASGRMDFIRFSGELFIHYVLIALGGGVMMGFMALIFGTIEIDLEPLFESWILPCGAVSAVIIASWLVESRKRLSANIAPMLARLFTPFFTIVLLTFLGVLLWKGGGINIEREILITFNMLLLVVLGLLLYNASARDPQSPPAVFDLLQVVLIVSALLADGVALWAITERITVFGFTPNRLAALGLNIILLVNLGWSALLYIRFLRGRAAFANLEQWQTDYLSVYAIWAAIVSICFPLLFRFN